MENVSSKLVNYSFVRAPAAARTNIHMLVRGLFVFCYLTQEAQASKMATSIEIPLRDTEDEVKQNLLDLLI